MLTAKDVGGMMAMMPAFATDEAADIKARNTVSIPRLHAGLDRMVRDGANVISTTGSFGECHALLPDEFAVIANESAAVMKQRVPLFVGVTAPNARASSERSVSSGRTATLQGCVMFNPANPRSSRSPPVCANSLRS